MSKRSRKKKFGPEDVERVAAVLKSAGGLYSVAAAKLGCDWRTVARFCKENDEMRDRYEDLSSYKVDLAESKMLALIKAGDGPTIRWFLERKAADRGFSTKAPIIAPGDGAFQTRPVAPAEPESMTDEQIAAYRVWQETMRSNG